MRDCGGGKVINDAKNAAAAVWVAADGAPGVLPDRSRAMPPVRTLLFLVPLVKALRPSTTPAKQLSTASSMKARVASQKAAHDREEEHKHAVTLAKSGLRSYRFM